MLSLLLDPSSRHPSRNPNNPRTTLRHLLRPKVSGKSSSLWNANSGGAIGDVWQMPALHIEGPVRREVLRIATAMNWKAPRQKDERCRLRCRRDGEMPAVTGAYDDWREQARQGTDHLCFGTPNSRLSPPRPLGLPASHHCAILLFPPPSSRPE
jgi:hypothetical protein